MIGTYQDDYEVVLIFEGEGRQDQENTAVILRRDDLVMGTLDEEGRIWGYKTLWVKKRKCKKVGRLKNEVTDKILRCQQRHFVKNYFDFAHQRAPFIPGISRINYAGRVYDEKEIQNLIDASLDFWLTNGRFSKKFESHLAEYLNVQYAILVNSGSSANLLAFMALTSPLLGNRHVKRGDEVITVAAGFPTTVAPIIQYGAVPVFVDMDLETANIDTSQLESALSKRTKAVILAHTLGNPFDISVVKTFCDKHQLWLIEDNCDALGSIYGNRYTGTWGDIGTSSFYPPHHLTMGEGGAVYTNNKLLRKIVLSMRDWGRDCWCDSGDDNTCGCRFSRQDGKLPFGYDHKYVYSHFGYNLKATDMQAAIGCAQLKKIEEFSAKRREHFNMLYQGLADLDHFFHLPRPTSNSVPSWFGFLITLKDNAPFTRNAIVQYLETKNIQTRSLFAGNITRHPCFMALEEGEDFRTVGSLTITEKIMNNSFWIGVYPAMSKEALDYMVDMIRNYVANWR